MDLDVHAGEVVSLLGENGAGKSTLMKILSGVWPFGTYEGEIELNGRTARFADTRAALDAGVAMIHQELSVFPELTVAEHLELDRLPMWIDWEPLFRRVQAFLDSLGFGLRARDRVGDLSIGGRQLVEIARALYRNASVLVFDEPTSALTDREVDRLYDVIEKLRAEGRGIVYITHRMDEIFRVSSRMVVLRDGRNAGEAEAVDASGERVTRSELEPRLISMMVGRRIEDIYPDKPEPGAEVVLSVRELGLRDPDGKRVLESVSFSVRGGEVLGLAGLLGAGRTETFEAIFGAYHPAGPRGAGYQMTGDIRLLGRVYRPGKPADAIRAGIGLVSEDRKGNGLVLGRSIAENIALPSIAAGGEWPSPDEWMRKLRIKAVSGDQAVGELSGGNQQKVVFSKWLQTRPKVLFLDEPTRGVDIGAKVEIYEWIARLAAEGIAIVVASSEMPELLGLCHRILVMRDGRVSAELSANEATQEKIMEAASL